MTVHKAQGMTVERLYVNLRKGNFAPALAYSSISRVRDPKNLQVIGFSENVVQADDKANEYYETLNKCTK
jgi:ATP-dependent exoDNAse (exonuclease V) alpha subunit